MITRRGLIKAGMCKVGMLGAGVVSKGTTAVADGVSLPPPPPPPPTLLSGLTARVGAQTRAGVEILRLQAPGGGARTGVSATGGTATSAAYRLSADGALSVANDSSMEGEDGKTITFSSDQGDGTIVLEVDNTYEWNMTVTGYDDGTLSAAYGYALTNLKFLADTPGGFQIILKDGVYNITNGGYFKNRNLLNELIFQSENPSGAEFTNVTDIYNASGYTFRGILFRQQFELRFGSHTIKLEDCEHFWQTLDPHTDWTAERPPGLRAIWGANSCRDVIIRRGHIHDWGEGIVFGALTGPITIEGNLIQRIYEDCIKIGGGNAVTVRDNVIEQPMATHGDIGSAHADGIQLLGTSGQDWENVVIERNTWLALYDDRSNQCVFLADMPEGFYYSGLRFCGNLLVNRGGSTTGFNLPEAKDAVVIGNTIVSYLETTAFGPGIRIGTARSAGTHTVKNNVADYISIAGPQSNVENNVILGVGGANIPYTAAFEGTDFSPRNVEEARASFAMKPGGPLDRATKVGAIGTGYVTFPATSPGSGGTLNDI